MGLYIKNMGKPENCHECPLVDTLEDCPCREMPDEEFWKPNSFVATAVHKDCPLITIEKPHGDLIDREDAKRRLAEILYHMKPPIMYPDWNDAVISICTAHAVIPADPAEEGET